MMNQLESNPVEIDSTPKHPWVAGLLALFTPGLGLFYVRKNRLALLVYGAIMVLYFILWFSPIATTLSGFYVLMGLILVLLLASCVYAMISAAKRRHVPVRPYDSWYVYLTITLATSLLYAYVYQPIRTTYGLVQFAETSTGSMSPALAAGSLFAWQRSKTLSTGDIAIYEVAHEPDQLYVFRCVGRPGDQVTVKESLVYLNGTLTDDPQKLQFSYLIKSSDLLNPIRIAEMGISDFYHQPGVGYTGHLTAKQVDQLKALSVVTDVIPQFEDNDISTGNVYPGDILLPWNIDHYGPIDLPQKGQTVETTSANRPFYEALIQLDNPGQRITDIAEKYTFNHDFYFMMGDNRHNAADSRFFGPVPDYLIRGRLRYVLWE